jgi:chromosomal replication initiator protein
MEHATFTNFFVGPSNQEAYDAAKLVAENPGQGPNPLLIAGPSGLGKTHLLRSVEDYVRQNEPSLNPRYLTMEELTNKLLNYIGTNQGDLFVEQMSDGVDVLLLDGIDFIAGKIRTQMAIIVLMKTLTESGRQVVMTMTGDFDEHGELISNFTTRFPILGVVHIESPGFGIRIKAIEQFADTLGLEIDKNAMELLADNIESSICQIEGAVMHMAFLSNQQMTCSANYDMALQLVSSGKYC